MKRVLRNLLILMLVGAFACTTASASVLQDKWKLISDMLAELEGPSTESAASAYGPDQLIGSWMLTGLEVEGCVFTSEEIGEEAFIEIIAAEDGSMTASYRRLLWDGSWFEIKDAPVIVLDGFESHLEYYSAAAWEAMLDTSGLPTQFKGNTFEGYYLALLEDGGLIHNFIAESKSEPYKVSSIHYYERCDTALQD